MATSEKPKDPQAGAIEHLSGPVRLIAGPGTGKTEVLVQRVCHLIKHGVKPDNLVVLTFTDATGRELRERLEQVKPPLPGIPDAGTLHSYAFRQLRKKSGSEFVGRTVLDSWEERHLLCEDLGYRISRTGARTSSVLDEYDAAWRTLTEPQSSSFRSNFEAQLENLRRVFDFALRGELVYKFKRFLDGDPTFSPGCNHLLVDEYQDLNACDLAVIKELTKRSGADLFVAGDDDQCIYKFRHADPSGIRKVHEDYKNVTDYSLDVCYRCGKPILDAALTVMQHEEGRLPKAISAHRSTGEVHVYAFQSPIGQRRGIAEIVKAHVAGGTRPEDILILVPRRDRANGYAEAISSAGVVAINSANPEDALDHPEVRRLLYAIRYAKDPGDAIALRGWLALTPRIGPGTVAPLIQLALDKKISLNDACTASSSGRVKTALQELESLSAGLSDKSKYLEILEAEIQEKDVGAEAAEALLELAVQIHADDTDSEDTPDLVEQAQQEPDAAPEPVEEAVQILTLHKAKGLTADVVIVTDLDDTLIPADKDVDEQRRLFYVSMTRAKHHLYLTHVTARYDRTRYAGLGHRSSDAYRTRSRFLDELGRPSESYRTSSRQR